MSISTIAEAAVHAAADAAKPEALPQMPAPESVSRFEDLMQQPLASHLTPAGGIIVVPFTALDISATAVRDMLVAGASPRYLLPTEVLDYIQLHKLYS